jgi:hypothetical protein
MNSEQEYPPSPELTTTNRTDKRLLLLHVFRLLMAVEMFLAPVTGVAAGKLALERVVSDSKGVARGTLREIDFAAEAFHYYS